MAKKRQAVERIRCVREALRKIDASSLKVWFVLGDFASESRQEKAILETCFPAVSTIAERAGMSIRTVQRAIQSLVKHGWLEVVPRPVKTHLFCWPAGLPSTRRWHAMSKLGREKS